MIREIFFILEENIKIVKEVPKILGNTAFDNYVDSICSDEKEKISFQPDIQKIIEDSVEFNANKILIKEKIQKDFKDAIKRVE